MSARAARRRLQPQARRSEIIEAAERAMRERGAATSAQDVVNAAGVARGTFYLYFPTWEDLVLEVRGRVFDEFERRYLASEPTVGDVDWPQVVDRLAVAFVEYTLELGGLHHAVFHGAAAMARPIAAADRAVGRVAALLRAGSAAGGLAQTDPEATAPLIFAILHETVDLIEAGADRERSLAAMRQLLRRALKP
jgi:AcrR family transcriptional regulator